MEAKSAAGKEMTTRPEALVLHLFTERVTAVPPLTAFAVNCVMAARAGSAAGQCRETVGC